MVLLLLVCVCVSIYSISSSMPNNKIYSKHICLLLLITCFTVKSLLNWIQFLHFVCFYVVAIIVFCIIYKFIYTRKEMLLRSCHHHHHLFIKSNQKCNKNLSWIMVFLLDNTLCVVNAWLCVCMFTCIWMCVSECICV